MGFTLQEFDLRETYALEKDLLYYLGIYPQKFLKTSYIFHLAATLNLSFCIAQTISMTVQMVFAKNDLTIVSECMEYFVTLTTFASKLANFVIFKKKLLAIEDFLTSPLFYGHSDRQLEMLKLRLASCKTVAYIFRFLCIGTVTLYGFPPLFDPRKSKQLPVPGWFPFDINKFYYPTYVFQMCGFFNTAYTNSTIDILTWVLINIATGQFDILKDNLKNIDYSNPDIKATEEKFNNCVKHYKEIVKLVVKIEDMFSGGIFIQFFNSVLVTCLAGFLMIIVPFLGIQFCFLVFYFSCMMCQVAMYCWCGHDVMIISSTVGESLYSGNWYESDMSLRQNIRIFMERTKRPVTLTGGKLVTLSLATLTTILRSAYSYIAVLRRLYNS